MAGFDIDYWTERVNKLTEWKNLIISNSKRIFQLPVSTPGTKLVAVHNETSGETEQFNLTDALSSISIGTREIKLIEISSYDFISSDKTKILICEEAGAITFQLDSSVFSANDVVVIHNEKDFTSTIQNIDTGSQDLYYNGAIVTTAINIPKGSMAILTCVSSSYFILNVYGKSFTITSENNDIILVDYNTEEAGQGTIESTITSFDERYQTKHIQQAFGESKTIIHDNIGGFTSSSVIINTAITSNSIEKESYSRTEISSSKTGSVTYKEIPPAIGDVPINVIIENPHKEISGTYRVATTDDIPSNIILYPTTALSEIATYYKLVSDVNDVSYDDVAVDVTTGALTTTDILISSLASNVGIFSGNITNTNITIVGNIKRTSGTANGTFYFKIYHRDSAGAETLIGTSETTSEISSSTYVEFSASALISNENFNSTDRIVYKFYGNKVGGGSNPTFDFQFGGTSPIRILTPVPTSLVLSPIYEILDLKADKTKAFKKIVKIVTSATTTSATTETLLETIPFSANEVAIGDVFSILIFFTKLTGGSIAGTIRLKASQTDYASSTVIATYTSGTTLADHYLQRESFRLEATNILKGFSSTVNSATDLLSSNSGESSMTINPTIAWNLYITIQSNNSSATFGIKTAKITVQ